MKKILEAKIVLFCLILGIVILFFSLFFSSSYVEGKEITFTLPDEVGQAMEKTKKTFNQIHEDVDVRIVFHNPNEKCDFIIRWKEDSFFYDNQSLFFRRDIIVPAGKTSFSREIRTSRGEKTILIRVVKNSQEIRNFPISFTIRNDGRKIKQLPLVAGCYIPATPTWWYWRKGP